LAARLVLAGSNARNATEGYSSGLAFYSMSKGEQTEQFVITEEGQMKAAGGKAFSTANGAGITGNLKVTKATGSVALAVESDTNDATVAITSSQSLRGAAIRAARRAR
jgi:hypothetical protein